MDVMKGKWRRNIFMKTWERCKSQGSKTNKFPPKSSLNNSLPKSKSWHSFTRIKSSESKVAPQGYFTVYVGHEKQRFVVKTEYANHELFKLLLDDAEMEYGYHCNGPIILPCDVDLFFRILAEMECGNDDDDDDDHGVIGCSNFSPVRCSSRKMGKGFGSYRVCNSSPMVKMNKF